MSFKSVKCSQFQVKKLEQSFIYYDSLSSYMINIIMNEIVALISPVDVKTLERLHTLYHSLRSEAAVVNLSRICVNKNYVRKLIFEVWLMLNPYGVIKSVLLVDHSYIVTLSARWPAGVRKIFLKRHQQSQFLPLNNGPFRCGSWN